MYEWLDRTRIAKEGVDDLDKASLFDVGAPAHCSGSSLMTTLIRLVLVGVIGVGTIVSALAAGPNLWLKITVLPELGFLAQVEEFRVVRSLKEWNALNPNSRQESTL
jgi:hypothetical protein